MPGQLQTIRVGRGYTSKFVVTLKDDEDRPVTGSFSGSELLDLVIHDGEGSAMTLIGSSAVWCVVVYDDFGRILSATPGAGGGTDGTILLTLDNSDTSLVTSALPRGLSIRATVDGEPIEVYRAALRVEPRAVEA